MKKETGICAGCNRRFPIEPNGRVRDHNRPGFRIPCIPDTGWPNKLPKTDMKLVMGRKPKKWKTGRGSSGMAYPSEYDTTSW